MAGDTPGDEAASPSLAPTAEPASEPAAPPSPFIVASAPPAHGPGAKKSTMLALSVGAIGVVFGDIGTSPLYAFREALMQASAGGGTRVTRAGRACRWRSGR